MTDSIPPVESWAYNDHSVGTEKQISAQDSTHKKSRHYHNVILYDPPKTHDDVLKWKCERCMKIYADPILFKREPCIPFGKK